MKSKPKSKGGHLDGDGNDGLDPVVVGGQLSPRRDKALIEAVVAQVRAVALCRPLLVAVDGLPSYMGAFYRAFRSKLLRPGRLGRAKLRPWSELNLVQVVKQRFSSSDSMLSFGNVWPI